MLFLFIYGKIIVRLISEVWNSKMTLTQIILGSIILVLCAVVIVCIASQQGKSQGLGAMAGGTDADTFFGRNKGRTKDSILAKITVVITILLALSILVLDYIGIIG